MNLTPEQMIQTLLICGNDPRAEGLTCGDCPYEKECDEAIGSAKLLREAAWVMENLLEKAEALKGDGVFVKDVKKATYCVNCICYDSGMEWCNARGRKIPGEYEPGPGCPVVQWHR